jgi:hypothetical protein
MLGQSNRCAFPLWYQYDNGWPARGLLNLNTQVRILPTPVFSAAEIVTFRI